MQTFVKLGTTQAALQTRPFDQAAEARAPFSNASLSGLMFLGFFGAARRSGHTLTAGGELSSELLAAAD